MKILLLSMMVMSEMVFAGEAPTIIYSNYSMDISVFALLALAFGGLGWLKLKKNR